MLVFLLNVNVVWYFLEFCYYYQQRSLFAKFRNSMLLLPLEIILKKGLSVCACMYVFVYKYVSVKVIWMCMCFVFSNQQCDAKWRENRCPATCWKRKVRFLSENTFNLFLWSYLRIIVDNFGVFSVRVASKRVNLQFLKEGISLCINYILCLCHKMLTSTT